jgi:hypothetical protein
MSNKVEGMTMNQDDEKLYFYINMSWLKAFVLLMLTVIIPYNLVMFLLWRLSVLSGPVWNVLSMGGAFAIAFVWAIIRKRRAANKE